MLKPIDMALNSNYLCFLGDEKACGDQIFVFDADNLEFLYSFAKRGSGPEETLALDVVKTLRGDTIDLIDQANYKKLTYILTPDSARLIGKDYLEIPRLGPLQETYWINDSIMIYNTLQGDLLTYNNNRKEIVDQINISEIVDGIPAQYIKKMSSFKFSSIGKDVFIGLQFFDELFNMRLDDDYKFDRKVKLSVSMDDIDTETVFNNYGYYSFINAGDGFVLAQYYGHKLLDLQPFPINMKGRNLKYDLILLDYNLNPIKKFQPGIDILRAFMDSNRRRIYYWDAFEDFDQLKYIEF